MSGHLTQIEEQKPSKFDAHHPPEKTLLADCVHCGFCLPACPTYLMWNEEMDSPRGRIYMMDRAAAGQTPLDKTFQRHMDNCLGCMACMTACPSGVQYDKLIEDTRGQVERNVRRGIGDSLFRKLLFATFPHPARLRAMAGPLRFYQKRLQKRVRASGLLKKLPKRFAAMEALLPVVPMRREPVPAITAAQNGKRRRVGMLTGCVQSVFFSRVNEATARVLAAEGCEVVTPEDQPCCGALMVHSGLEERAAVMAKRIIEIFERAEVDTIVVNAAGCGSTMKEYGHLLRGDKEWEARAQAFSAKCRDISEILCELPSRAPRYSLKLRVAYHDACHLRHAQGIWKEPRELLTKIPGLQIAEIAEPTLCCGSAGVYNLLQPEPAMELGDRKVEHLLAAQAEAVVSANPGCLLQLMAGLERRGEKTLPTFHMVELLDASIRGVTTWELLWNRDEESKPRPSQKLHTLPPTSWVGDAK
jgi:glycolate oxidase iron-sulfur subunit